MAALVTTLLNVNQGVDFEQTWRWTTQDNTTYIVTPKNLTGWTAFSQIRSGPGGYLLQDDVPVVLGGDTGTITLQIPAEMSWAWTWEMGKYDIVLFDPDGIPQDRFAEGFVVVSPGTSHAEG